MSKVFIRTDDRYWVECTESHAGRYFFLSEKNVNEVRVPEKERKQMRDNSCRKKKNPLKNANMN